MTPSESSIEYAVLTAGGWPRDLREKIVERAGVSADELAATPELLKNTIARHRQENPEHFLPARIMREIEKIPELKRALKAQKEAYRWRDRQASDARQMTRVTTPRNGYGRQA